MGDERNEPCVLKIQVIYGIIIDQFPYDALPRRYDLPPEVQVRPRFVMSRETPLQYDENEEAPEDEEPLSPDDFANSDDFYWAASRGLAALYGISTEGLTVLSEKGERASRWILGVVMATLKRANKHGEFVAYPLPLTRYAEIREQARPFEARLEAWADELQTGEPQIIFAFGD